MKRPSLKSIKHKKAFTFVELLIAMVILAIVSGAVIMLAYTYFNHFEQANELSMARERGIMVATYLEKRILNAGLGMPTMGNSFTDAFEGLWNHADFAGEEWEGPVFEPEAGAGYSDKLMVAYAIPSGVYTISSGDIGSAASSVAVSRPVDSGKIDTSSDGNTKGWVVFPSVPMPFRITDYNNSAGSETVDLLAKEQTWYLAENDELHHVRFMAARVDETDGRFKVKDLTLSGEQPVVEGILGCRFSLDEENSVLSVSILARGDRRYSRPVSGSSLSGWGAVDEEWRHYYLAVVVKGWRVRN